MDPNDSNQTTNPPQQDTSQADTDQQQKTSESPQQADTQQPVQTDEVTSAPAEPSTDQVPMDTQQNTDAAGSTPQDVGNVSSSTDPATDQTPPAATDQQNANTGNVQQPINYVDDVGGDMIGLLDEINDDDKLVQEVADEMQLEKEKVKSILAGLLNKIDQGQVTAEEIALMMAATVADQLAEEEN
jgi:hypothetical protein